jgi:hypothetical protein
MRSLYFSESYYTVDDLYEAFDIGLDTALFVLERIAGLPYDDQMDMLLEIKSQLENHKVFYLRKKFIQM